MLENLKKITTIKCDLWIILAMKKSITLFQWENEYAIKKEILKWTSAFSEKYWSESIFKFNFENWDLSSVNQALFAWWLFVTKKLIIIEWIPKDTFRESGFLQDQIDIFFSEFQKNFDFLTDDTFVVFVSYKPDSRTKVYKWLKDNVEVKEFPAFREPSIKKEIVSLLSPIKIWDEELSYFISKVWKDMFRIENEVEKLKLILPEWAVVSKDVIDKYCVSLTQANWFEILENLFVNPNKSIGLISNMQEEGREWIEVNWLLLWGVKIFFQMLDCKRSWIVDSKQIASELKVSPFVVLKNMKILPEIENHEQYLKELFKEFLNLDFWIKSWKYIDSYYWLAVKRKMLGISI
jgi:DNA polymerase III delta subunit